MPTGSADYRKMEVRLNELRSHLLFFLPTPPQSSVSYSPQQLDATRAYVILAHAEIEAFCEAIVSKKIDAAKTFYDATGKFRPSLRRLVTYHVTKKGASWHYTLGPTTEIVEAAYESFRSAVKDNHGVKRKNLERLLFPIGVLEPSLNATWLADMDSFGGDRGVWAHNSARTRQPPDPLSQLNAVRLLLQGLLQLDRMLSKIR